MKIKLPDLYANTVLMYHNVLHFYTCTYT